MTHWIIREWMNAITLALFLCLAWRFVRVRMESPPGSPRREAATALAVLCAGEIVRSAWAWLALASQNKGWEIFAAVQNLWIAGVTAAALIMVGAVCCLRVFSGGNGSSLVALLMAAGFLVVTMVL